MKNKGSYCPLDVEKYSRDEKNTKRSNRIVAILFGLVLVIVLGMAFQNTLSMGDQNTQIPETDYLF